MHRYRHRPNSGDRSDSEQNVKRPDKCSDLELLTEKTSQGPTSLKLLPVQTYSWVNKHSWSTILQNLNGDCHYIILDSFPSFHQTWQAGPDYSFSWDPFISAKILSSATNRVMANQDTASAQGKLWTNQRLGVHRGWGSVVRPRMCPHCWWWMCIIDQMNSPLRSEYLPPLDMCLP